MESQPQNPEFRNNPENFHTCITEPCITFQLLKLKYTLHTCICKSQLTDLMANMKDRQTDGQTDKRIDKQPATQKLI